MEIVIEAVDAHGSWTSETSEEEFEGRRRDRYGEAVMIMVRTE